MKKSNADLPARLRNGTVLPKSFSEIRQQVSRVRYKIVATSIDGFDGYHRLVHAYYVGLLGEDPSRLQALMKAQRLLPNPNSVFEDGKRVENMLVYRAHLLIEQMIEFGSALLQVVQDNSEAYAMVRYHNVVQYSSNRFDPSVVYSSIDV